MEERVRERRFSWSGPYPNPTDISSAVLATSHPTAQDAAVQTYDSPPFARSQRNHFLYEEHTRFPSRCLPIPAPLVIPITQLLNTSGRKEPFSSLVALPFVRISMSATVQLHGHPCAGTVKIQQIWPKRMLPPKLEPGKTASPKRSPQLLFLLGLLAAQPPGLLRRIHARKISNGKPNSSLLSSNPSGGEGKGEEALLKRDAQRKSIPNKISPP